MSNERNRSRCCRHPLRAARRRSRSPASSIMAFGSETDLEGGASIVSAGLAIYFLNWLFRIGVDRRSRARRRAGRARVLQAPRPLAALSWPVRAPATGLSRAPRRRALPTGANRACDRCAPPTVPVSPSVEGEDAATAGESCGELGGADTGDATHIARRRRSWTSCSSTTGRRGRRRARSSRSCAGSGRRG